MPALHTRYHPYRARNWQPLTNSDGATYVQLRERRLAKVRELARLEGFWNEARDWQEWAWYHEAKAHLAGIVRGSSSDRRAGEVVTPVALDKPAGNLYLVTTTKGDYQ